MVKRSLVVVVLGLGALSLGCGENTSGGGGSGTGGSGTAGSGGDNGDNRGTGGTGGTGDNVGTGGTSGSNGIALAVEETVPQNAATGIELDSAVTVRFDAALDGATLTSMSFTVHGIAGIALPGNVTADVGGPTATFTPQEPLALAVIYTATVTTEIKSVDGNSLRSDYAWSFTTRDGVWSGAVVVLPEETNDLGIPTVAIDPNGNATAVWGQGRTRGSVLANRYTPGEGWLGQDGVDTDNPSGVGAPEVAVDAAGNVIAVWNMGGLRGDIWTNRYKPGEGWGEPALIEVNNDGTARQAHVAMAPDGRAVAVWTQSDGTRDNIWANRFTPQVGWAGAELIETDDAGDAETPRVAVDPSGNAIAVWAQSDATETSIWANRFTPQMGWGSAQLIELRASGVALVPQIAMDFDGNAIAVWQQSDLLFRTDIWANRFTPSNGWETTKRVDSQQGTATNPQIAVAPAGDAIAVWEQVGNTYRDMWANRFTPDDGWETPALLEIINAGDVGDSRVAIDAGGNAIAVWKQDNGIHDDVWANRYMPGTGWSGALLLEQADGVDARFPRVAINARGRAVVVWPQLEVMPRSIWANHFE